MSPETAEHGTNDFPKAGHVFVTAGDVTKLHCDAVLVPTDVVFHVTSAFAPLVGRARGTRLDGLQWADGEKVTCLAPSPAPGPRVWLADVTGTYSSPSWIDDVAAEFVARAADSARSGGERALPLLALPVIGTGAGGSAGRSGAVSKSLLDRLCVAAKDHCADVVLVTRGRASYSAAQSVRHRSLGDDPLIDDFDLGEPQRERVLTSEAARLAGLARADNLVLFLGAGVSAAAGLPAWQALIDRLAVELPDAQRPEDASLRSFDLRDQAAVLRRRFTEAGMDFAASLAAQVHTARHGLTHELTASIPTTEAVTTNYDGLFEQAVRATGDSIAVLPMVPDPDARRWLLKLHGDLNHASSMVLTREDYLRLPRSNGALFGLVQAMLMTRHMLFIGYSLSDEDFHQLVDEVRAARAAGPDTNVKFGTVLTLFDDPLFHTLWSDDLTILSMAPQPLTPGAPTGAEVADAARRLQIFLDLLGLLAADRQAFLLDPDYVEILDEDEQALRDSLITLAQQLPNEHGTTWDQVRSLLDRMGHR